MIAKDIITWHWYGSTAMHLDTPYTATFGNMVVGCYGGNTSAGADDNEDGALIWCAEDGSWELAVLLDGHDTTESVELLLQTIENEADALIQILAQPASNAFASLHANFLAVFKSPAFRARCQHIRGETACLICVRKEQFLWWFCAGDCAVYLFHPELAHLKQYALNQRSFFEWIGHVNTFELSVPCYASGVRELRSGHNRIVMTTDGLLELDARPFEDPAQLYHLFTDEQQNTTLDLQERVATALTRVHQERGRDSATILAWDYVNPYKTGR